MQQIEVLGVPCVVLVEKVPADIAHPGEDFHTQACEMCRIVKHPLSGSPVLVWGFKDTGDFTVSRNDPNFPAVRDSWPQ